MAGDSIWYKDGIIDQTHVKAFLDTNGGGIGVGDLQGLTRKLDYLRTSTSTFSGSCPSVPHRSATT